MTKLSRSQIGTLSRDLDKLDQIEKLLTKLNEIRAANGRCAAIGEAIRRTIGPNTMSDAPPDDDLSAAALDGIIARNASAARNWRRARPIMSTSAQTRGCAHDRPRHHRDPARRAPVRAPVRQPRARDRPDAGDPAGPDGHRHRRAPPQPAAPCPRLGPSMATALDLLKQAGGPLTRDWLRDARGYRDTQASNLISSLAKLVDLGLATVSRIGPRRWPGRSPRPGAPGRRPGPPRRRHDAVYWIATDSPTPIQSPEDMR